MPSRPPAHRPPGSAALAAQREARRGSAAARGYGSRWRGARAAYLQQHPLCAECLRKSPPKYSPADVVDHVVPHRGDHALLWAVSNWRPLCKRCHDRATVLYDGGFGRPIRVGKETAEGVE